VKRSSEIIQQKTDYKELFYRLYRHKKWFVISLVVLIGSAFIFNKLTMNTYKNQTTLLLQEDENKNFMAGDNIMQGFGLFNGNQNIENEIGILESFTLINDAILQLNLEATQYKEESMLWDLINQKTEIYKDSPIRISIDKSSLQPIDLPIYFRIIDKNKIKIEAYGTDVPMYSYLEDEVIYIADSVRISGIYKFEDEIKGKDFNFKIHLRAKDLTQWKEEKTFFVI